MKAAILTQIEQLLETYARERAWGAIEIDVKDGKPILIRQTKQNRVEENPANVASPVR